MISFSFTLVVSLIILATNSLVGCTNKTYDNVSTLTKLELESINAMSLEKKAYILSYLRTYNYTQESYTRAVDAYNDSHKTNCKTSSGSTVLGTAAGVVIGNAISGK